NAAARRQLHSIDVVSPDSQIERVSVSRGAPASPAAADKAISCGGLRRRRARRGGQEERQDDGTQQAHITLSCKRDKSSCGNDDTAFSLFQEAEAASTAVTIKRLAAAAIYSI